MDWGGANSRFLGLVSVWAARSFDQTALRPSVIKRIRQIDVKYITHITSFGVTAWTRVTAWTCMCELPRCTVHWTRISIHWILDFKQLLLLLLLLLSCGTLWISAFWHIFVYGRYHKSRLVCLKLSDLDWSRHNPLCEQQRQPSSGSACPACPKKR